MVVETLMAERDAAEIARDQIAAILAMELQNQWNLAKAAAGLPDFRDYKIGVYREMDEPWGLLADGDDEFPLVNVCLQEVSDVSGGTATKRRARKATVYLDCYATAAFSPGEKIGQSAVKAWKAARVVRNIIEAANYAYLGLRGVIKSRNVERIETLSPNQSAGSARVCVARLSVSVEFDEFSPQVGGPEIEPIPFEIDDETGRVIA